MPPPAAATLPVVACLDDLRAALAGAGHRRAAGAARARQDDRSCPLALLDEPWLGGRRIVMLEPRRLATRAAARRMAALPRERVGETVGYRTRDDRRVGPATRIEVVTEGILTRRLQRDPGLEGVGLVIFDEFHERSLQADLGPGAGPRRPPPPAPRPAPAGDVGDARRRPGRGAARGAGGVSRHR